MFWPAFGAFFPAKTRCRFVVPATRCANALGRSWPAKTRLRRSLFDRQIYLAQKSGWSIIGQEASTFWAGSVWKTYTKFFGTFWLKSRCLLVDFGGASISRGEKWPKLTTFWASGIFKNHAPLCAFKRKGSFPIRGRWKGPCLICENRKIGLEGRGFLGVFFVLPLVFLAKMALRAHF